MRYPSTDPVVITCALTGGIHGKEANPNLPEQPDEIVEQGIAAWRAGAAILHVHARNPDGSNTMDPAIYGELARAPVRGDRRGRSSSPPAAARGCRVEERLNTVLPGARDVRLNMGLLNFFIRGEQVFFANHRSDIERFAQRDRRARRAPGARGLQRGDARGGRAPARRSASSSRRTSSTSCCTRRPRAARAGRRRTCSTWCRGCARSACRGRTCASTSPRWAPTQLPMTTIAHGDGLQRPRREWRTTCSTAVASRWTTTPSWSSGRSGSRPSSTGRPATPAQARELLALRGRTAAAVPS